MGWDNARLPVPETLPPAIASLILQMWAEPAKRPGFGEIIDRLKPLLLVDFLYPQTASAPAKEEPVMTESAEMAS